MTAKEYLKQARYLDLSIDAKLVQVSSLRELATKATSTINDVPVSYTSNNHQMEDIVVKILMLENEINSDIDRLIDLKNNILNIIKTIDDDEGKLLLEKRYLNLEPWEKIASEMCCGIDNVYKIHKRALKKIKIPKTLQ